MILHTTDRRLWGQDLNVQGRVYTVEEDGHCLVSDSGHAIQLLKSGPAWSSADAPSVRKDPELILDEPVEEPVLTEMKLELALEESKQDEELADADADADEE